MLSKSAIILHSCILLIFNSVSHAEQNSTQNDLTSVEKIFESNRDLSQKINLSTAIHKTFDHNPKLQSFNYAIKAQKGRQLYARLAPSPEVSFELEDALGTGEFNGVDNAQATLSIGWVMEGDIREGFIDVAQAGTLSVTNQARVMRLDAAAETARLYINTLAEQARLSNALETKNLALETVSAVNKRVIAGRAPEAELARAEAELSRRKLNHQGVIIAHSTAMRTLAAQWGDVNPSFLRVDGNIFDLPKTLSFESLKNKLKQNPELSRLMSDKRLMQAQLKLAKSQSKPEWQMSMGVRHLTTTNDQALVAGFSMPFGERTRNVGRIVEAQENLSKTLADVDALKLKVETSLYVLSQQLQFSLLRVETYREQIIPQLEKALKQTRRAYNLGRYSYLEWRSVQVDLLAARSAFVEASIDAHLKVIEIERLTGVTMVQQDIKS